MKLSKAKELIENGTHYITESDFGKELLNLSSRKPIYFSEITDDEEIVYQMYFSGKWRDCVRPIRIKPKLDFSKELEALNKKANENNMKVIVTFENNL
jgi:hypothetical protein